MDTGSAMSKASMPSEPPPFEKRFVRGYFVRREIPHEELITAIDPAALIVWMLEELHCKAQYHLFGGEPTQEAREAYYRRMANLSLREILHPPPPPWKNWWERPVPEPIFTNVRATDRGTTIVTVVVGGRLRKDLLVRETV